MPGSSKGRDPENREDPGAGGSPAETVRRDRDRSGSDANPVPGTAENERAATRGEDAPDPVAEGKPQPTGTHPHSRR